uniref:Uncharacterized protein n=1 Tax=Anguilla anguilla TaxID=7936 RepID=A0A0E9VQV7_ANGAN
MSAHTTLIAG